MTSQYLFHHLGSTRILVRTSTPKNAMHKLSNKVSSSQYSMEELEPWPEDDDEVFRDHNIPSPRTKESDVPAATLPRSSTPDAWKGSKSSSTSSYKRKPKAMFSGPPPPIAASVAFVKASLGPRSRTPDRRGNSIGDRDTERPDIARRLLFDHMRDEVPVYKQDSIWRGLYRREKALEKELQRYLDLQASGLLAGSSSTLPMESDMVQYSDTGSSTPTGTFYSTATSKSRMASSSLYTPTRSTPEGNVIPVRQPKPGRSRGLKSVRLGLRRSIAALAELKFEEEAHLDDALAERRKALGQLNRLDVRKTNATAEIRALAEDEEEPLGLELRDLSSKYDGITQEIRELEERLIAMRNQQRWLRVKMEDVRNKREAGLSGYRGALKNVESEVANLMRRPPVQPLDLGLFTSSNSHEAVSTEGLQFMRLIPERRTIEMAKSWWDGEVSALERRKAQIEADKEALVDGGAMWAEVMQLVSGFESRLSQIMKGGQVNAATEKGKEKALSQHELICKEIPEMDKVVHELENHQRHAEEKGWNLLICAIGAELEAFIEAQQMVQSLLEDDSPSHDASQDESQYGHQPANTNVHSDNNRYPESSDNEVGPDLLLPRTNGGLEHPVFVASPEIHTQLQRVDSENDVPAEFLVEYNDKSD